MRKPLVLLFDGCRLGLGKIQPLLCTKYDVRKIASNSEAFSQLSGNHPPDLIIALTRHAQDFLAIARQIREKHRTLPIIVLAMQRSEELLLEALRSGVSDYVKHPFEEQEILDSVERCLSNAPQRFEPSPGNGNGVQTVCQDFVGRSEHMRQLHEYVLKLANSGSHVLVTGETGTGKELIAQLLHRNSARRDTALVSLNCAAIPDSLVESELFGYERGAFTGAESRRDGILQQANGGTVFLDEIGDMSLCAQAKILRALETKLVQRLGGRGCFPLDVRIIAATNQDLEQLMTEGRFRKDLYYRLNVARVHLPSLRERKEDIVPLIEHYTRRFGASCGRADIIWDKPALECLTHYEWPGNVRELKNLIETTVLTGQPSTITCGDLPLPYRATAYNGNGALESERDRLMSTLRATNWNKSKAAQKLQWSRMTLYRKMARYQIAETGMPSNFHV